MLEALKFVQRAASDKDIIHAFTHICVRDGRLQGNDSKIALECACPELAGLAFTAPADKFIKAISACDGIPKIEILGDQRIKISYKRFRVTLPTLKVEDYPSSELKRTNTVENCNNFIEALRRIFPFISQDASRPWSLGAWLENGYAYATNNVTLVRTPIDWQGTPINLPRFAVDELLNVKQKITSIHLDETSLEVEFGESWFKTQTYVDQWPPSALQLLEKLDISAMSTIPDGLAEAVDKIIPFCPDVKFPAIYLNNDHIATANGAHSAEMGFDLNTSGIYRAEVLQLVLGVAQQWAPATYPAPVFFTGDQIEGMFVGIRV